MTNLLNASDEACKAGRGSQPGGVPVSSVELTSPSHCGGSDLHFIDVVLADLIVFARLNQLSGLEGDLMAAQARFVAQVGRLQGGPASLQDSA